VTALDDALAAAQSKAIAALGKRYVRSAEPPEDEAVRSEFAAVGFNDELGVSFLLAAWKILREQGEQAPDAQEPRRDTKPEPATEPQLKFIRKLCDEKQVPYPDEPLSKANAHEVIESLRAGTYDAEKWQVPF
jgi:hypothetical protein